MRPVDDVCSAVVLYDYVGGIEVTVAYLVVLGHSLKTGVQLVSCCCVEVSFADLAVHLVLELVQQRALCSMNLHLKVNEHLKIFVLLGRILLHQLSKCLALDEFRNDSPLAVNGHYFKNFRNVDSDVLYACLVKGFVEYIVLGIALIENLDKGVTLTVDRFSGSDS